MDTHTSPADLGSEHLKLVQDVADLWFTMQLRLQAHFAALAAEHSLSAIQAKVLLHLGTEEAVPMRSLAGRLQYDPSNLTSVIDRLEALGAVQRRPDPGDRRIKGLVLTAMGAAMREEFSQRLVSDVGPWRGLGVDELSQLRAILRTALAAPGQA